MNLVLDDDLFSVMTLTESRLTASVAGSAPMGMWWLKQGSKDKPFLKMEANRGAVAVGDLST